MADLSSTFEYIVLGGGVIGCATAYFLARAGYSVALVEQFEIGHNRGSSHGESRITRLSYDHPLYVQMAKRSFQLWEEIESEWKEALQTRTGGLDIGIAGDSRLENCIRSMDQEGVPYELLDSKEMKWRFPQFRLDEGTRGVYQPHTGILHAAKCVDALCALARKAGASVYSQTAVTDIQCAENRIFLETAEQTIRTTKLALCAGAWSAGILSSLGLSLPLVVTLEQWAFFSTGTPENFMPGKFPIFIKYDGTGSGGIGWYGFPIFGRPGVKSAIHSSGPITTAEARIFEPDQQRLHELKVRMTKTLPDAAGEIIATGTCLYTNSPDQHFVIDRIPGSSNIAFFTGCSGHAFKFAPLIAEALIALLRNEQPPVPLDFFRANRFN